MTKLNDLYEREGQSPWMDDLHREWLTGGHLRDLVGQGVRGVTSNPTIFAKAIEATDVYDQQFRTLIRSRSIDDAYWEMVIDDIEHALEVLRPVHESSGGADGFVSLEVAPSLANDTEGSVAAARSLHQRIDKPNLLVKVPGTPAGVPAIRTLIGEGRSINVTLIFSLDRYDEVIEAYLSGLEAFAAAGATDLSHVHSVASFFVSRVDTEVDRRIEALAGGSDGVGDPEVLALRGKAAVAQAQIAYEHFTKAFRGDRWSALAAKGARVQRPLWASTSTKNPSYSDLLYVDSLIGPDTVNTMPEQTLDALLDHGTIARTVDADVHGAHQALGELAAVGIDMEDVSAVLEDQGVSAFAKSFDELLQSLSDKANALS
ncbi:MAG TPA: transaldolase [Acidimicrobiales bacterium]|nr:transaldolase [Acidimicrobiales bacterium]